MSPTQAKGLWLVGTGIGLADNALPEVAGRAIDAKDPQPSLFRRGDVGRVSGGSPRMDYPLEGPYASAFTRAPVIEWMGCGRLKLK